MNTALAHGHALYANANPSQASGSFGCDVFCWCKICLAKNIAIWKGTPQLHTDLLHNFGLGGLAV